MSVPAALAAASAMAMQGWPAYGGDAGGQRFSDAAQITPTNVDALAQAWLYRTSDLQRRPAAVMRRIKFETTPILFADALVLCSSFNEVIALDPGSGAERWRYDPGVAIDRRPANRYNCRGVAQWRDGAADASVPCALRIFSATADLRLIALDAHRGTPCSGFGNQGSATIDPGPLGWPGEMQITSAPVVAGDVVIVGSAIGDNQRSNAPSGEV